MKQSKTLGRHDVIPWSQGFGTCENRLKNLADNHNFLFADSSSFRSLNIMSQVYLLHHECHHWPHFFLVANSVFP